MAVKATRELYIRYVLDASVFLESILKQNIKGTDTGWEDSGFEGLCKIRTRADYIDAERTEEDGVPRRAEGGAVHGHPGGGGRLLCKGVGGRHHGGGVVCQVDGRRLQSRRRIVRAAPSALQGCRLYGGLPAELQATEPVMGRQLVAGGRLWRQQDDTRQRRGAEKVLRQVRQDVEQAEGYRPAPHGAAQAG